MLKNIVISLPQGSIIERWKKQSLTFLFRDNLNNSQINSLLYFIDEQLALYNICDLSSSNKGFTKLLQDLKLQIPERIAIITKYNLKFALSQDAVPNIIYTIL